MDQLKSIQLTVAKLCHELAGPLSIMKFLQEDLAESKNYEVKELLKSLDLLIYTMDFFRLVYSSTSSLELKNNLLKILEAKQIKLKDDSEVLLETSSNLICGILYLVTKSCKPNDIIVIEQDKQTTTITADNRAFPTEVEAAFNNNQANQNVFNIFVLYLKQIAKTENLEIASDSKENRIKVKIWKEK